MCGVNFEYFGVFDWYCVWFVQLVEWGVDFVKVDDIVVFYYYVKEVELICCVIDVIGCFMVLSLLFGFVQLEQVVYLQVYVN